MKTSSIGRAASLVAAIVLVAGPPALAADQSVIRTADIALATDGTLQGTVLNTDSEPVSDATVTILHGEATVAEATTNARGEFAVKGLRNGAHTVHVAGSSQPVRFWTSSAPPNASPRLTMVSQQNVVRAQSGNGNLAPLLLFGGAVAVVLATTLDDDNNTVIVSP